MRRFRVDPNANFGGATYFPPIGNDEELVRSYLSHFLLDAADAKEFEPYINDVYLKHLLAEVKIVNGLGNAEQWASLLPPAQYKALKDRVDIDFAFTNPTDYDEDDKVTLELFTKNVSTLMVKVFEINTTNFYRQNLAEVNTDVNLDGLVANAEQTHHYAEAPLRRMPRRFEFPQLSKPGVYVVDFIGNGVSSRALIRKGRLHPLVKTTTAGQQITVVDDNHRLVKAAVAWLGGQEYHADKDGTITVPFSTLCEKLKKNASGE